MQVFLNAGGWPVLERMADAVRDEKDRLGEIDGLIGDGDHGANMNKGFSLFRQRYADRRPGFIEGLDALGTLLFTEIGGSMGPIYGTLFTAMASAAEGRETIDAALFGEMLAAGLAGLYELVDAREGDKTLIDALAPAVQAFRLGGEDFAVNLARMSEAAAAGRDATTDRVARYGRASRLGERARGVPDAGAWSCCLLLRAMAGGISELLAGAANAKEASA